MKFVLFFISFLALTLTLDVSKIRLLYKEADTSKINVMSLHKKLETVTKSDNKVLVAYKGAVMAMTSKYESGLFNKTEVFKNGVSIVEYALKKEPKNLEIRFVRLSLQQNSPKILRYNKHIDEDKKFIFSSFHSIKTSKLKNYLKDYILHSNNFTEEEKNVISQP